MTNRIVIVGGGLAAARVATAFRKAGGTGSVTMLSADTDPPYNRPPLSKGFLRGEIEADAVFVEPEAAYAELDIDLRLDDRGHGDRRSARARSTLADGERAAVRPARARVRLAAARARDAGRGARRRATATARSTTRAPCAPRPSRPRARS